MDAKQQYAEVFVYPTEQIVLNDTAQCNPRSEWEVMLVLSYQL